ncbi:MAG: DUF998 domain-containing protein [Candidatus Hermodarchaeota archaeon]
MIINKKHKLNFSNWPISCKIGILIIIISWGSMIISIILAPTSFSPLTNYMSSLGNSTYNPNGAFIYNSSVTITGVLFFIFFIGLYQWYSDILLDKIILLTTQVFGFLLAITIMLTGIFSEDFKPQHVFWSIIAGILGFLVNVSIALYLFKQKESIKKISYLIFGLIIFYVIFLFILSPENVLTEWIVRTLGDINLVLMLYNFNHIYQVRKSSLS